MARTVDPQTGELAVERCPERVAELFGKGGEPRKKCSLHRRGVLNWFKKLGRN